jgi:hypothetical protein
MSDLLKINVSDHCEKKNGLTYLSWAWAWAEVLKIDPQATWEAVEFDNLPVRFLPDETAMVKTLVTINKHAKSCWLPVMDHRNKAIKKPDAFAINTALVRCLTKTIALHGLGLYIYAGEDLPEGDELAEKGEIKQNVKASGPELIWNELGPEDQTYCRKVAARVVEVMPDASRAVDILDNEGMNNDQKVGVWYLLDSKTRSSIKAAQAAQKEPV